MVSDNAAIFTSEEFEEFCKEAGIFQKFIAPGHPATNGLAERNIQTLKHRLQAMSHEPFLMYQRVRDILFRYRATPLNNGKTPAEQYLPNTYTTRCTQAYHNGCHCGRWSKVPDCKARQLSMGTRVQARYYANNKMQWKFGTIIKKMGQLHYLIKLDDGYQFKRHIDQLRATDIKPQKTVSFAPDSSTHPPTLSEPHPNMGDIVEVPISQPNRNDKQNTTKQSRTGRISQMGM